jgi:hypothetical protein
MAINSSYEACAIVEGFAESDPTNEELIEAWAYLIKTGDCWNLQGFYGREATRLIQQGFVSKEGEVNWDLYND